MTVGTVKTIVTVVTVVTVVTKKINKTNVIRAYVLDLHFDLGFEFEEIFTFCNISVMKTFQFW